MMFETLGTPVDTEWSAAAERHILERIGNDVAVFVIDSPDDAHRLIAVAAGSIHRRLPVPSRPDGSAGFVQWVSTDPQYRRRGASRALIVSLMAWFGEREVEVVELHATPAGEPLYRSLGFGDPAARNLRWTPESSPPPATS